MLRICLIFCHPSHGEMVGRNVIGTLVIGTIGGRDGRKGRREARPSEFLAMTFRATRNGVRLTKSVSAGCVSLIKTVRWISMLHVERDGADDFYYDGDIMVSVRLAQAEERGEGSKDFFWRPCIR